MGVAVGEETAWTYVGLWNIKCCFTAAGTKWENDHVATSRSSPFYSFTCLTGSHSQEPSVFLFCFPLQNNVLWSPVRKYQPSAESAHGNGSFDPDPLGVDQSWGCDERAALTRLKRQVFIYWLELNTLNQETWWELWFMLIHTLSDKMR